MGASAGGVRAGKAYVELYSDNNRLTRGLAAAKGSITSWAKQAAAVSAGILGADAIKAGAKAIVSVFTETGSQFVDMADRTGASVEALSTLGFAAQQTGSNLEDVEAGMRKLAKSGKFAGQNTDEAFRKALLHVASIQNPLRQAEVAMELFGKSGTKLIPMAKDLENLENRARSLGLEMSEGDAQAADSLGDSWDELVSVGTMLGVKIGAVLAPAMQSFVAWATEIVGSVGQWIAANREVIDSFVRVATSGDVLWTGLQLGAQSLVNHLYTWFLQAENFLLDVWDGIADGALVVIGELKKAWANFGAWLPEAMKGVGDTVFEVQTSLSDRIAAAFLRATGDEASAKNLEDFSKKMAKEREVIRQFNAENRVQPAEFAQIDKETAAARKRIGGKRQQRGAVLAETIGALEKDLNDKRRKFDKAFDAALQGSNAVPGADRIPAASSLDIGKMTALGTFSASAAQGIAGISQLDDIVTATKQTAKNTKNLPKLQPGIGIT